MQAVFQALPADLALPYLDALDKLRSPEKVAQLAASLLKARAQTKRRRAQRTMQQTLSARVAEIQNTTPARTVRTGAEQDALRIQTRDWLAARMAQHGTSSEQAHRMATNAAQTAARG